MSGRGTVRVARESRLMRIYESWRRLAGQPGREQIDLCHFIRVILIFAPWRWFWQKRIRYADAPPYLILVGGGALAAAVFAVVKWPGEMLHAAALIGLALLLLAVVGLAAAGLTTLVSRNPAGWENALRRVGYYGFVWLWWPALQVARAARWFSRVAIEPAGRWLFTKQLFSFTVRDELFSVVPFAIVALALLGVGIWLAWLIVAMTLGGIVLAVLLIGYGSLLAERHRARSRIELGEEPREPSVVWSWLVAKKHRICPLIEVKH